MKASRIPAAVILTAGLVLAPAAHAAYDAFLKIGDIKGESQDPKHKDWIEIDSYQFDQVRSAASSIGSATGGAGAGKVRFTEFTVTKKVDKASSALMKAAASGKHFAEVVIEMRKAGGSQQEYLKVKLENVFITNLRTAGGGALPTETLTLNFGAIKWEYTPQRTPTPRAQSVHAAPAALAARPGTITDVKVQPASVSAGGTVTITVEGTGECKVAWLDFGDHSQAQAQLFGSPFPKSFTHAFASSGTFTVVAWGYDPAAPVQKGDARAGECVGKKSATVVVRSLMTAAPALKR